MAWKVKNEMPMGRLIRGTGSASPVTAPQGLHQEPAVFEHPQQREVEHHRQHHGQPGALPGAPDPPPASQLTRTERIISRIYTGSPQA